jgi:hypothetical protein
MMRREQVKEAPNRSLKLGVYVCNFLELSGSADGFHLEALPP